MEATRANARRPTLLRSPVHRRSCDERSEAVRTVPEEPPLTNGPAGQRSLSPVFSPVRAMAIAPDCRGGPRRWRVPRRVELELLEDVAEMRAHRVRRGEQPRCHFAVNQTLDDQAHDRQLGVGQRGQATACGRSGGQATADPSERGRRRTGLASRDMPARCRSPAPRSLPAASSAFPRSAQNRPEPSTSGIRASEQTTARNSRPPQRKRRRHRASDPDVGERSCDRKDAWLRLARSRADLKPASARSVSRTLGAMRTSSTSSVTSGGNRGGMSIRPASPRTQSCGRASSWSPPALDRSTTSQTPVSVQRSHDCAISPASSSQAEYSRRHTAMREEENMSTQTKQGINGRIT